MHYGKETTKFVDNNTTHMYIIGLSLLCWWKHGRFIHMRGFWKRTVAVLLSATIIFCAGVAAKPQKEVSADAFGNTTKSILFGEDMKKVLKAGSNTELAPIVYYGKTENNGTYYPVDWNVIGFDGEGVTSDSNSGCVTIFNRHLSKDIVSYNKAGKVTGYLGSDLQSAVNNQLANNFSSEEKAAMKARDLKELGGTVQGAKLWPISKDEYNKLPYSLRRIQYSSTSSMPTLWWTRTASSISSSDPRAYMNYQVDLDEESMNSQAFVRSACNIDLSKIAYISAAEGAQYGRIGHLDPVPDYYGNEWKLAIYDENQNNFNVVYDWDPSNTYAGETLEVAYSCKRGGDNCYITAVIADENGKALRYGYIGTNRATGPSFGIVDLPIPADLSVGKYKLKIFQRIANADKMTDYVSNIVEIPVTVKARPGNVTGLKAESAGKNKVKLTWNAVKGAEGYLVYAQKNGQYDYVGMTTSGTTYTDSKALDTDYNYYWVFAYVKKTDVVFITGGCAKYVYAKGVCLAVTNLKASSQKGSVKLSWTASAGAEGYLIYGIRPGGSYGYIGMTTQGTTYTDTKASKTDYTFYWVFPYHKTNGQMIVGGTAKYTYGKAK